MAALDPAVAAIRSAVRAALGPAEPSPPPGDPGRSQEVPAEPSLALVACSGGPDSMALAAAAGFVAPRLGWRVGLVTVDHDLQPGSERVAARVTEWAEKAGFTPVEAIRVSVAGRPGGPEAAARTARYQALSRVAARLRAAVVLLGHTRDDQAETVLLALARGSGPRGLAGMPPRRAGAGPGEPAWLRPLLEISRAQTAAACAALGLETWQDPHNADPSFARARVRAEALPALVAALGDRVVDNLARTARLLAADTAVLDELAAQARLRAGAGTAGAALAVPVLAELPDALRTRVLHGWALELGAPGSALSHRHVSALDALVTRWHGQGPVHLPGGIGVARRGPALQASEPPAI